MSLAFWSVNLIFTLCEDPKGSFILYYFSLSYSKIKRGLRNPSVVCSFSRSIFCCILEAWPSRVLYEHLNILLVQSSYIPLARTTSILQVFVHFGWLVGFICLAFFNDESLSQREVLIFILSQWIINPPDHYFHCCLTAPINKIFTTFLIFSCIHKTFIPECLTQQHKGCSLSLFTPK